MTDLREIKIGDRITTDVPIRRKWWQIWKPRQWIERRAFVVTDIMRDPRPR